MAKGKTGHPDKVEMVKKIIKHHFGSIPKKVDYKASGLTNFVFEIALSGEKYIVRIGDTAAKINDYQKEQWAIGRVKKIGVPVADILEVGNSIIELPYMIQKSVTGIEALHHPNSFTSVYELGKYAALIHSVRTNGYGTVFDWSDNKLSKKDTWKAYLQEEFKMEERLVFLEKNKMLLPANMKKLRTLAAKMIGWNHAAVLNHGDLRLKNVIVNDKGKVAALLDWENCISNIAPQWDLSIALHDLSIDERQQFLNGYGLSEKEYKAIASSLKVFNILNYTTEIQLLIKENKKNILEQYRLRLNGYYDLYSL